MQQSTSYFGKRPKEGIKRVEQMETVYICSPYRAKTDEQLKRNVEYAQELTREVLMQGGAPITVHLYMTQCLSEDNPQEREIGLAAGRNIVDKCDIVVVGQRFGITEGMEREMRIARDAGIKILYHS